MERTILEQALTTIADKHRDALSQQKKCKTDRQYFWLGKANAYSEDLSLVRGILERLPREPIKTA